MGKSQKLQEKDPGAMHWSRCIFKYRIADLDIEEKMLQIFHKVPTSFSKD